MADILLIFALVIGLTVFGGGVIIAARERDRQREEARRRLTAASPRNKSERVIMSRVATLQPGYQGAHRLTPPPAPMETGMPWPLITLLLGIALVVVLALMFVLPGGGPSRTPAPGSVPPPTTYILGPTPSDTSAPTDELPSDTPFATESPTAGPSESAAPGPSASPTPKPTRTPKPMQE